MIGFYDDIITRLTNESALRMIKMAKNLQSVEPNIVDLANRWLKSYELDYKLEQESLNDEINRAVDDCFSKNGGKLVEIGQMLNFFYRIGIFDIYPQTDLPCQ